MLLINGESGLTKPFDFGRYNRSDINRKRKKNEGTVRRRTNFPSLQVPNWNFNKTNDENVMGILKSLRSNHTGHFSVRQVTSSRGYQQVKRFGENK